jgi:hypothetical protein
MIQVPHKRRPRRAVGDLLGRAAHVDIYDVGALGLGDPGPLSHPMRLASRDLDHVDINAAPVAAHRCLALATDKAGTCRHFGHHQAGAKCLRQPTERRIGNPRHGRQNHPVRRLCCPDIEFFGQKPLQLQHVSHIAYRLGVHFRCTHFSQMQQQRKCCTAKNCLSPAIENRCACEMERTR